MSDVEIEAVTYVFTWRTSHDDHVCQWCNPVDGQVIFYDLFSDILVSDSAGPVWDLNADRAIIHEGTGIPHDCRCTLEVDVEVDWGKIAEFQELRENLAKHGITIEWLKERFNLSSSILQARNQMQGFFGDLNKLKTELRETNDSLTTYLALGRRAGSEDIRTLISLFQQGRITAEIFTRAIITLVTASGPWGWVLGLGQLVLGSLMLSDMMQVRSPRY